MFDMSGVTVGSGLLPTLVALVALVVAPHQHAFYVLFGANDQMCVLCFIFYLYFYFFFAFVATEWASWWLCNVLD